MQRAGWFSLRILLWGVCILVPVYTVAQQQAGGLSLFLDYSERLEIDDDEAADEEALTSSLDFSLRSVTRRQSLAFDFGGDLEKTLSDGTLSGDFTNPRLLFSYGLQNRDAALSVDAFYRIAEISRLAAVDILGETALVLADGDREDLRLGAQLEFGRTDPFGGTFGVSRSETRYSGAGTAGLLDTATTTANMTLRFTIDPRITARVIFALEDLERDGGQDVRETRIGLGASLGISKTLQGEVEAGISRVETDSNGIVNESTGEYYSLGLLKTLPNGTLRGSLNSSFSETGRRTTLRLDRQLARKRDQLRFGVGVSKGDEGGDLNPLYSLGYSRPLPRGGFTASLEQAFGTSNAGEERLDTRLLLAVQQNLSPLSSISASFNFRDSSVPGNFGDQQQINVGVDYSRVLTEDWSLVAGYSHIRRDLVSGATDRDNRIYLGVNLRQAWRP